MTSHDTQGISSEKAAFLSQLLSETRSKNKTDMMPFLLSLNNRINQSGLSFNDEETELIIKHLTGNFSPQERKKVEMLRQFSKMLSSSHSKK